MAKSIRSKSKRRFRALKRESIFGDADRSRTERLADKQAELVAYVAPPSLTTAPPVMEVDANNAAATKKPALSKRALLKKQRRRTFKTSTTFW